MKYIIQFFKRVWLRFMYPSRENVRWRKGLPQGLHENVASALQWKSVATSDVFRESMPAYVRWIVPKIWCALFRIDNLSADVQMKLLNKTPMAQAFLLQCYKDEDSIRYQYIPIHIYSHKKIAALVSGETSFVVYVRKVRLLEACSHQPNLVIESIAPITDCFEPIRCSHGYVNIEYLTGPAYTPLY